MKEHKLHKLATAKFFMMRSLTYVSIVNAAMILFLVLATFEEYGIDIDIQKYFFLILVGGILLLSFFGFLEDKIGLNRAERHAIEQRNPYMNEIIERLERIEKRVRKLK